MEQGFSWNCLSALLVAIGGVTGIQVCRLSFDLQQPKWLVEEEREEPGCLPVITTPYRDVRKGWLLCVAGVDTPYTSTSQSLNSAITHEDRPALTVVEMPIL